MAARVAERAERSLRRLDGEKFTAGCNYCLTFQRVNDYALPRCTLEIMEYLCSVFSSARVPRCSKRKLPWSFARTFETGACQLQQFGHACSAIALPRNWFWVCQVDVLNHRRLAEGCLNRLLQIPPLRPAACLFTQLHRNQVGQLVIIRNNQRWQLGVLRLK